MPAVEDAGERVFHFGGWRLHDPLQAFQPFLSALEQLFGDKALMLAGIFLPAVAYLADVDRILQDFPNDGA